MNWPPMLSHLRVPTESHNLDLWLPFFLLYPLLLSFMLLLAPLAILAAAILWAAGKGRRLILVGPWLWAVLFELRGLRVYVQQGPRNLTVNFV